MKKGYDNYVKKIFHDIRLERGFLRVDATYLIKYDQYGHSVNMLRVD